MTEYYSIMTKKIVHTFKPYGKLYWSTQLTERRVALPIIMIDRERQPIHLARRWPRLFVCVCALGRPTGHPLPLSIVTRKIL